MQAKNKENKKELKSIQWFSIWFVWDLYDHTDEIKVATVHFVTVTFFEGVPEDEPTASIAFTTFLPSDALPNTT